MKQTTKQMFWICFFCFSWVSAQQIEVRGIVISKTDNQPLMGVSVIVKDKTIGTSTDYDGNYLLNVIGNDILVFSSIGFKTLEISVQGRTQINVTMEEEAQELSEVVAVGYRTERKADLTGAVSVVKVDEMMKASENNAMKALQGRVAGMQITNDGNPAGKATIRIRGIGTMNSNDPLYVIDGVPTTSGMHELNSNDIESIQVLRDASSASIYGSRAANGVIVITTKKGKQGKIKVDFDHYTTVSSYHNPLEMLNSEEYAQVLWKAAVNGGNDANSNGLGIYYDESTDANGYKTLNKVYYPKQYYDKSGRLIIPANTDWFHEISRMGVAHSYNLSVSNGTEKGNYFFSLGYYKNEGLIKYTDFERISARINSDYKLLGDVITIGENFTINRTSEVEQPGNITEQALRMAPFLPVHTADGKGWAGPVRILNDRQNPMRMLYDNQDNRYNYWRTFGSAFINVQPIEKMNIRSNFGLDYGNFYKRALNHSFISGFLEEPKSNTYSLIDQAHWMKWNWTNTFTYDFTIGKNHRFETLAGMEMFSQNDISFGVQSYDFIVETPEYMWPSLGTGKLTGSGISTGYKLMSYFGKINYAYADKYLVSGTLRYDGSSRFHKDNRWGTFPAFNLGWRISQESFMESLKPVVSDLKLRFGWGQNGNQESANYAIYDIYAPYYGVTGDYIWSTIWNTSYDINGNGSGILPSGIRRSRIGNTDLKWETTTQTNFGLDFAFFDNKLYGSAEYYIKKTKDILVEPPYAGVKGEGAYQWVNGAGMENKGLEISLGYRNQTESGFHYDINANISTNKNKVTTLPESVINAYGGNGKWDNILGRPYGSFYGYVADGLFKTQDDVDQHPLQNGKAIGRIRYKDLNNDGVVNEDDRTWIGDPYPDFVYGLNVALEYKNFDLSLFLQGVHNMDINVQALKQQTDFWHVDDVHSNKGKRLLRAFDPVSNPNSDIPMIAATNPNDEGRFSTYFVENGSYLKLRNIQIGYSLPESILEKLHLSKLRLYISGQNLFQITSKSFTGQDPENPAYGYPIPITFTTGLNLSF
ncbi:MAG: TonB-dependent receptor [Capnocytophaga sp.]|nr:TonB-dependent receptor [Capnocytophaga sp.]